MRVEDVKNGMTVRAAGHAKSDDDCYWPDAPEMVVREIVVLCSWFTNGVQHTASFKASELEPVEVA